MVEKEKIEKHYNDVKDVITDAIDDSFATEYNNEEENKFAEGVKSQLAEINESFKKEIDELEQSSEWDKFCISFFGETNAGKSTIIESLRIIYNEESRLQKIVENRKNLNEALNENNKAYLGLTEETKKLKELLKARKKTVSLKVFVISVVLAAIIGAALTFAVLVLL